LPQHKKTDAAFRENKRFAMIGFALDDDRRKLDSLVKKMGILWPQVQLAEEFGAAISKSYKIKGIPTDYVIGPDGKIISQLGGVEKAYIDSLLSKK